MDEEFVGRAQHHNDQAPKHGRNQTAFAFSFVHLQERRPARRASKSTTTTIPTITAVESERFRRGGVGGLMFETIGCARLFWGGGVTAFCGVGVTGFVSAVFGLGAAGGLVPIG